MDARWLESQNETKAEMVCRGRQVELAKRRLAGEHPASLMVAELAARHSQRPHWRDLQVGPAASGCHCYCRSCRRLPCLRWCRGELSRLQSTTISNAAARSLAQAVVRGCRGQDIRAAHDADAELDAEAQVGCNTSEAVAHVHAVVGHVSGGFKQPSLSSFAYFFCNKRIIPLRIQVCETL